MIVCPNYSVLFVCCRYLYSCQINVFHLISFTFKCVKMLLHIYVLLQNSEPVFMKNNRILHAIHPCAKFLAKMSIICTPQITYYYQVASRILSKILITIFHTSLPKISMPISSLLLFIMDFSCLANVFLFGTHNQVIGLE